MLAVKILLYILAALAVLLLLLLFLPSFLRITYNGELRVRLWVLGVPLTLLPAPPDKKQKKAAPPDKKAPKPPGKGQQLARELTAAFREDGLAATLELLRQLAVIAGQALGRVLRAITVDSLRLELLIAAGDPATTAVRYGEVCGVLYPALAAVGGAVRIRRRQVRLEPNFLLEQGSVQTDVRLHLWNFRLLWAGIVLLVRFVLLKESPLKELKDDKEETSNG